MEEEDLGATVEEKGTVAEEVARAREEMAAVAKVVTEAVKAAEGEAADSEAAVDWAVENTEVMAKVGVKMKVGKVVRVEVWKLELCLQLPHRRNSESPVLQSRT
ncbi:hypothetical protein CYMTET_18379 [Cymbomonas tetramitiformis]|uniref:Uncharacterized protein n=1 Tax=Cymbomonas tetramitiformis TaxID=36881 RepID=A0AAE0L5Y3_9CHLO|nr:hypothetical protein CYMTET_18379 [Cymbomonas tetramitiformis]